MTDLEAKEQNLARLKAELRELRIKLAVQFLAAAVSLGAAGVSLGFAVKNFVEASDMMPQKMVDVQYELREDPNNYNPSSSKIVEVKTELESLTPEIDKRRVEESLSSQFKGVGWTVAGIISLTGLAVALNGVLETSGRMRRRKRDINDTESEIEYFETESFKGVEPQVQ